MSPGKPARSGADLLAIVIVLSVCWFVDRRSHARPPEG